MQVVAVTPKQVRTCLILCNAVKIRSNYCGMFSYDLSVISAFSTGVYHQITANSAPTLQSVKRQTFATVVRGLLSLHKSLK